jgi:hypothetical protein
MATETRSLYRARAVTYRFQNRWGVPERHRFPSIAVSLLICVLVFMLIGVLFNGLGIHVH